MEDRSPQILGVAVCFLVMTWVAVGLRVYVRTCIIKAFGLDDSLMVLTQLFCTGYIVCQIGSIAHGNGKHRADISDHDAQIALCFWFFCEIFYVLCTSVLKVSVGYFLLRITVKPTHVLTIRVIMFASLAFGVAYTCIILFQCRPISYWWDLNPNHHGKCLSASLVMYTCYVVSALNAAADWIFGILPIFIVKDLQMKKSAKIVVATIIGFAALGSTATIVRMPYLYTLKYYKGEFLWRTVDFAIWTTVEVGVGITAACVATLKPLLRPTLALFGIQSTQGPGSDMPWSTRGKSGLAGRQRSQQLDDLRPSNDKSLTTTTVTGRRASKTLGLTSWTDRTGRDSEDYIFSDTHRGSIDFTDTKGFQGGISKSVQVTTTEERNVGIPGNGSSSGTETDDERTLPNPAKVYERF
ncbi:hypothetical protein AAFC00_000724 [Neodothiora populina]|uniref:Rhodopsin domain-containing protein n=1 Tax=Neodothiora populina TaxID=2781224 RepID=A0ABR3PDU1_9PEZI